MTRLADLLKNLKLIHRFDKLYIRIALARATVVRRQQLEESPQATATRYPHPEN